MLGINKIILLGTVGRNPETRYIDKGVSFSRFSVVSRGEGGHRVYEVVASDVKILARSKDNAQTPIGDTAVSNNDTPQTIGSALPNFDIENIPVNLKGEGDSLPF